MKKADKGARVGNFIIDGLIVFLLAGIQSFVLGKFINLATDNYSLYLDIYFGLFTFAYYFFFELLSGKTPGKYLTKTSVVNYSGERPTMKALLIRNAARLISYDAFSFIFGQGLHDDISGTTVVFTVKLRNDIPG